MCALGVAWRRPVKVALDVSRLTCLYAESPAERSPQMPSVKRRNSELQ